MVKNILNDLLASQKAEVLETMLTTFNRELYEKEIREDAMEKGEALGARNLLLKLVQRKLEKNCSIQEIADALEEEVSVIQELVNELNN